jgi:hypothetical protein
MIQIHLQVKITFDVADRGEELFDPLCDFSSLFVIAYRIYNITDECIIKYAFGSKIL